MFRLDTVLPSSSLAAEAVLAAGINLQTAELPPVLQADLLLLSEGCVGRWGLLGYTQTMETGLEDQVPQLWQWEVIAKGSVSLPMLDISRPGPTSWLLEGSSSSNFVPITCKAGYRRNRLPLTLTSVKHTTPHPRNVEDRVECVCWLEGGGLVLRERLAGSLCPSEDFYWQMELNFSQGRAGERSGAGEGAGAGAGEGAGEGAGAAGLSITIKTKLGSLPVCTYTGRYTKL